MCQIIHPLTRVYTLANWPFRKVGSGDKDFDLHAQIDGCARLINAVRELAGEDMWSSFKQSGVKKQTYARILKKSFKDAIRISGESLDFMLTVDYVTCRAMDAISSRSLDAQKVARHHISTKERVVHHEHMVPGEELCRELVSNARNVDEIKGILDAGSSRAIIFRDAASNEYCEKRRIDTKETKCRVPAELMLPNGVVLRKADVPAELHGLFRYHFAGLIDELLPVSERGAGRLQQYRALVANLSALPINESVAQS